MTAQRRDGYHLNATSDWIRGNPRLDSIRKGLYVTDLDILVALIHRYKDKIGSRLYQHQMIIESKDNQKTIDDNQAEVLFLHHQSLKPIYEKTATKPLALRGSRGQRIYLYQYGVHSLTCSGNGPEQSARLVWDRRKIITLEQLEKLLLFELNPFTLLPQDLGLRRHHTNYTEFLPGFEPLTCIASSSSTIVTSYRGSTEISAVATILAIGTVS